jgi:hypothetical protein
MSGSFFPYFVDLPRKMNPLDITNRALDKSGLLAKAAEAKGLTADEAGVKLAEIIENSTREGEGGQFVHVDESRLAW